MVSPQIKSENESSRIKCFISFVVKIIVTRIKLLNIVLQNAGKDCWGHCSSRQGPCPWCGTKGMCCTKKPDWTDKSNGCDGTFGGATNHECVLKTGR